ncbi:uncharacterized protein CTRU02_204804 [Colletotrichum truncatum]|uniref:Uncharacterized protein n=1 Tax=Colletotrichum truncatum TaxID=5467 RepID=A0ACC3ZD59_COLTU|nr:uncharacterized protein CTRU02_03038 [Colletotrichum truncatum]KAF6797996.1 hypothetical protein CTRU02_03038 [Colletotrichum truncatum]
MLGPARSGKALLFAILTTAHYVLGQGCESLRIKSPADAEAARNCPEIFGDVIIYYNQTAINLDGVKVVHGYIATHCPESGPACDGHDYMETFSSNTLTTVNGNVNFGASYVLKNIPLPQLATVKGMFTVSGLWSIKNLDISSLDTLGGLIINAPGLENMKHTAVRAVTGFGDPKSREIYLQVSSLKSLGNFFEQPITVDAVTIEGTKDYDHLDYGFAETGSLVLRGSPLQASVPSSSNMTITFGGSQAREITIGKLDSYGGLGGVQLSPELNKLSVGSFASNLDKYGQLHLPFDQLGSLTLKSNQDLQWLSNTPKAENWVDFSLRIQDTPRLNITSEYNYSSNGEQKKVWYWPHADIGTIKIDANVTNAFFESFLQDRSNSSNPESRPKVLDEFNLSGDSKEDIDCRPFNALSEQSVLPSVSSKNYTCYGLEGLSSDGSLTTGSSGDSSKSSAGPAAVAMSWKGFLAFGTTVLVAGFL